MPLFDYRCPAGHVSERLAAAGTQETACLECGEPAARLYSRAAVAIGPTDDVRGMYRRFAEASEEITHQGYDGPSLWRQAKYTAREMIKAGENPVARSW